MSQLPNLSDIVFGNSQKNVITFSERYNVSQVIDEDFLISHNNPENGYSLLSVGLIIDAITSCGLVVLQGPLAFCNQHFPGYPGFP